MDVLLLYHQIPEYLAPQGSYIKIIRVRGCCQLALPHWKRFHYIQKGRKYLEVLNQEAKTSIWDALLITVPFNTPVRYTDQYIKAS